MGFYWVKLLIYEQKACQFVFRQGPVPFTGNPKRRSGYFRDPKTFNERCANQFFFEVESEEYGVKLRKARLASRIPTDRDDLSYGNSLRNWKRYRKTQYK